MVEKKCLMIIERHLSPPHLNKKELIYCGKEIKLTKIPKRLSLDSEVARKYLYTVSKIEKNGEGLKISQGCFNYEELRTGVMSEAYRSFKLSEPLDLPLESRTRKSIIDLLSE